MSLIERTIYPRINKAITKNELINYYTPSNEEINLVNTYVKDLSKICVFLTMLKLFKRFRYFPNYNSIPDKVITYIKESLSMSYIDNLGVTEKTIQRYKQIIRVELNIKSDKEYIKSLIIKTVEEFEPLMDHPADVFNAVIETLIKNNCELPAFSTLERVVNNKRAEINNNIFNDISSKLTEYEKKALDLIIETNEKGASDFNYIKEIPKSPTLNHMKDVKENYLYLKNINYGKEILKDIHMSKVKYFAAQGNALDASEMKDFTEAKRYTIMLCFIYNNTIKTGDDLITMFIKRIGKIHNKSKENLEKILEKQRIKTENIVEALQELLISSYNCIDNNKIADNLKKIVDQRGGYENLLNDCQDITAYNDKNYYPLLWKSFRSHRKTLFEIIKILNISSTTQNESLIKAINYLLKCEPRKSDFIDADIDISFVSEKWHKLIKCKHEGKEVFSRRYFEMCVFSYISSEFKTGDICVEDSEEYADYRKQLLTWEECKKLIEDYCREMDFPASKNDFINSLKNMLKEKAAAVDRNYPNNSELVINETGEAILKRKKSTRNDAKIKQFKNQLEKYMPERNIMEILCNVEHWLSFTKHFGPLSGSEPKLENPKERYIILTFGYGSNMGPTQTSKHIRGAVTPHMIHFTNKRHINEDKLDKAITDIINCYNKFSLPKMWGDTKVAAADGTKIDLYDQNLLSEYHIRYGGYGGIAYHHVSDTYIALFSHFIPCGVWEAVYIIDGLLKNKSDIQPDTVHADTQGQSTPVFALTYLLGIKLMPRIRNWKDLKFYKADKNLIYNHIESLFKETIDWKLIETHYEDLFQVILSIKSGKILPSTLLRKLNNYSRKNKLYQAFRELGNIIRTVYLLDFISNIELREKITESTNKTEAYNGFSKWFFFGGDGIMCENDPEEQSKIIKYNDLLANAVILHNVVDISNAIERLNEEGIVVTREDIKVMSPYMTSHIKRFGEYIIDLDEIPQPIHEIDIEKIIEPAT